MREDDIPAALRLCRLANWNQVAADWRFFLAASPDGCRAAVDHMGNVIGTAATIAYGGAFSWIGMVLVDPQHRRAGIGTQLLQQALQIIGDGATGRLDATPAGRAVYVPLGFEDEYELQRMVRVQLPDSAQATTGLAKTRVDRGSADGELDPARQMTDADFAAIVDYDREVFGADRRALLDRLRHDAPEYAWAIGDRQVEGYIFGRHGHSFEHMGPLVAGDERSARRLVCACTAALTDRPCLIDVPRTASWVDWLESQSFTWQRPFFRMRRGERRYRERVDRVFAIAGPEFG